MISRRSGIQWWRHTSVSPPINVIVFILYVITYIDFFKVTVDWWINRCSCICTFTWYYCKKKAQIVEIWFEKTSIREQKEPSKRNISCQICDHLFDLILIFQCTKRFLKWLVSFWPLCNQWKIWKYKHVTGAIVDAGITWVDVCVGCIVVSVRLMWPLHRLSEQHCRSGSALFPNIEPMSILHIYKNSINILRLKMKTRFQLIFSFL